MIQDGKERGVFKRRLLKWYDANHRDMPWRRSRDPYHILLSEFMLQQTQVQTVIPYFERFVHDFPTVTALARADLDEVLKRWEGLGYYTRARNLHKSARTIVEEFDGIVPTTYLELSSLPGFGPYTSAAVASIAFGRPHAVLDGNVIRVLARIGAVDDEVNKPDVRAALQTAAEQLLNAKHPGDHNQAMMELGATICTSRRPKCDACPVSAHCRALTRDLVDELPRKARAKARPERVYAALIVRKGERILISRRKPEGLLGGLWEFPTIETGDGASPSAVTPRIHESLKIHADGLEPFRRVTHTFTHFSATVHAYLTDWKRGRPSSISHDRHAWVTLDEIQSYAYSRIARKLVDALVGNDREGQMAFDLEKVREHTT